MKKPRYELEQWIEKLAQQTVSKTQRKIINELYTEFNIPISTTSDILSLKRSPSVESPYVLYHLLKKLDNKSVSSYFLDKEIVEYDSTVIESEKVKFPLKYKVIQIADDQWIGKITAQELMNLGGSQLINYNENAQRVLKRIVRGGEEYYRIQINKAAVEAIKESLLLEHYIPNTITLNIPEDDETHFVYNEENSEIVIKKLSMFDILDGYHRYIAMYNLFIQNPDFDQVLELRLTNFSTEKARQFIWQEDQKTKMRRVDSEALNNYSTGNQIVTKLKSKGYANIIGRNGIIDEGILGQDINAIFLRPRKYTNSEMNFIAQTIVNGLNAVEDKYPEIFDRPIAPCELHAMLIAFSCDETDADVIKKFAEDALEKQVLTNRRDLKPYEARHLKNLFKERRQAYV